MANQLTPDEAKVMNCLTDAWNRFIQLPPVHSDEMTEFRHKFHDLQRIVLARPAIRAGSQ
ncbi:MAG: hypothetical protein CMH85_12465 [Novosphingobium sp.]|nr:hypothetical protein [Novosphingobium sp.]|tara:strand:- start:493 stop:672 length:180 start_codon:yes stop_codon:yes gene_type:complete